MRETIRMGRIAGIPVGVNWTVGLIAMLLVSSLAGTILPLAAPGLNSRTYILVGVVAALGFFGSILAHELGHSIVAIRRGVPVDGITLWLLGGVARLRKEPEDARTELMVASAGPATSAALAVGLGITAIALGTVGLEVLAAATAWLATINVILAVFNLIPAAPLDGGRILAGVLWLIHGDRDRAKWTATSTGRAFGVLLIAVAVWSLTAGGGFGVWALMLGFFVLSAANGERRVLETRRRLAGLTVRQAMSPLPIALMWAPTLPSVRADAFVNDVVPQLANGDVFVVDELGRAIGTVGLDHLARLARFGPEIAV
jgi:Zn-dependent protease